MTAEVEIEIAKETIACLQRELADFKHAAGAAHLAVQGLQRELAKARATIKRQDESFMTARARVQDAEAGEEAAEARLAAVEQLSVDLEAEAESLGGKPHQWPMTHQVLTECAGRIRAALSAPAEPPASVDEPTVWPPTRGLLARTEP